MYGIECTWSSLILEGIDASLLENGFQSTSRLTLGSQVPRDDDSFVGFGRSATLVNLAIN
jgi:hypothetical protein